MTDVDRGVRATCYFCDAAYGSCTCRFHDQTDEVNDLATLPGFDWQGATFWITQPNVSVCGRFFVDPTVYYGEAYVTWSASDAGRSAIEAATKRGG